MRSFLKSGSVRGVPGDWHSYRDKKNFYESYHLPGIERNLMIDRKSPDTWQFIWYFPGHPVLKPENH
jgi:hypothetical protein